MGAEKCSVASEKKEPTEIEVRESAKQMRWGDRKSDLIWSAIWNTDTQKPNEKNANLALIGCDENTDILRRIQAFQKYLEVDMQIAARASDPHEADRILSELHNLVKRVEDIYNEFRKARKNLRGEVEKTLPVLAGASPPPQPSVTPAASLATSPVPSETQENPVNAFLAGLPEGIQSDVRKFLSSNTGALFRKIYPEFEENPSAFSEQFLKSVLKEPTSQEIQIAENFLQNQFGYDKKQHGENVPKLLARFFEFNTEGSDTIVNRLGKTINNPKAFIKSSLLAMGISFDTNGKISEVSEDAKKMLQAGSQGLDTLAENYKKEENVSPGEENWESFWTWIAGIFSGKTLDDIQDSLERIDAKKVAKECFVIKSKNDAEVKTALDNARKGTGNITVQVQYLPQKGKSDVETFLETNNEKRSIREKQIGAAALGLDYPSQVKDLNLEMKINETTSGVEVMLYKNSP